MVLLDTEYVRAVVHNVSHRARRGVASKVRALKAAHSQARLRSYSHTCERAAYIDGRCEFYPSLSIPTWTSSGSGAENDGFADSSVQGAVNAPGTFSRLNSESEKDESAKVELRRLMSSSSRPETASESELRRLVMFHEFRNAGVDVNTTQVGYGYGIDARIEPIRFPDRIPEQLVGERRNSCPSFGTQLYNEPIYEGDEDPLGLGIAPAPPTAPDTVITSNGLDGIDLLWKGVPAPIHNIHANGDFVSNWPQKPPAPLGPLDKLQKQFEDIKLISTSSGESTPTTARSKADEWLDDVLRVSMSMSPTSPQSSGTTVSTPPTSSYSTLPKSGPPPAHAPPPLPVRQAVSNGSPSIYQQQNSARNSPAGINWNSSPNPIQMSQIPAKPVDPFDVQWSRLAVNNTN
ncbi:hypothetical protein GCK72_021951 [Caenorhabditis remanei]|uniref:Uncharacterized protein n=1 Tax=Caenorhabditis remanei TaxID=31234 RepID=A0A6A5GLL0_CAERE|nr:hypothetical protein GCK72_021951 [Caenorhabditis remanei]KAF1755382.1 hypothetical protein GCK72_021951 [Caenorhabditis remanei]